MARNLGTKSDFDFFNEDAAYDSVVFRPDKPILSSELNLAQELANSWARKASSVTPSGWISSYPPKFLSGEGEEGSFYTQDPTQALPELALVNGWVLDVAKTRVAIDNVNKIVLDGMGSKIDKGSRVDGVFLEVWRGLVADEMDGLTAPVKASSVPDMRGIHVVDGRTVFMVGDDGSMLRYQGAGVWDVVEVPTSADLRAVAFNEGGTIGIAVGTGGSIIRTTDSGASWYRVNSGVQEDLNDVDIAMDGEVAKVLVAGGGGTILLSNDGGLTYEFGGAGDFGAIDIYGVYFMPGTGGKVSYLVGSQGLIARRIATQSAWYRCQIKEEMRNSTYKSISFINPNEGFVVGLEGASARTTTGDSFDTMSVGVSNESANFEEIVVCDPGRLKINLTLATEGSPSAQSLYQSFSYNIEELPDTSLVMKVVLYRRQSSFSQAAVGTDNFTVVFRDSFGNSKTVQAVMDEISAWTTPLSNRLFDVALSAEPITGASGAGNAGSTARVGLTVGAKIYAFGWMEDLNGSLLPKAVQVSELGDSWDDIPEWEPSFLDANVSSIYCAGSFGDDLLFISGKAAFIAALDTTIAEVGSQAWEQHSHELYRRVLRRIYNGGNKNTPPPLNLNRDNINPNVGVPVSDRVQVQYKIRIVTGVDPLSYPGSGLGSAAAMSEGPNPDGTPGAPFESMGPVTGDYGLFRAVCRNTVDGFSYAIPMFLVHRKNTSPFNPTNNINGSTVEGRAVRPDGTTFDEIGKFEVTDVRRKVLFDGRAKETEAISALLTGKLATSVSYAPRSGSQYGSTHMVVDSFAGGQFPLAGVPSVIQEAVPTFEGALDTSVVFNAVFPFKTLDAGYYSPDPTVYTDTAPSPEGEGRQLRIGGRFDGLGTSRVTYAGPGGYTMQVDGQVSKVAQSLKVRIANLEGVSVVRSGAFYSWVQEGEDPFLVMLIEDLMLVDGEGTAHIMRYGEVSSTEYAPAISEPGVVTLESVLPPGLTLIEPVAVQVQTLAITRPQTAMLSASPIEPLSVRAYSESDPDGTSEYYFGVRDGEADKTLVEARSSLGPDLVDRVVLRRDAEEYLIPYRVEANLFARMSQSGEFYLDVPKEFMGYTLMGIREVRSLDGKVMHRVKSLRVPNSQENTSGSASIRVEFEDGYAPALGSVVQVWAESYMVPAQLLSSAPTLFLGVSSDQGVTLDSYRAPLVAAYAASRSGLRSLYKSSIVAASPSNGLEFDISVPRTFGGLQMASPILASMATIEGQKSFVWDEEGQVHRVASAVYVNDNTVRVRLEEEYTGRVFVPITYPIALGASERIQVAYRSPAPQTITNLGEEVEVEVTSIPEYAYISGSSGLVASDEDPMPFFHAILPTDPRFGDSEEYYYAEGGLSIPGVGKGLFLRAPMVSATRIGGALKVGGRKVDSRGNVMYSTVEGGLSFELPSNEKPVPRKVAAPFLVKVVKSMEGFASPGEVLLGVVFRTFGGSIDNKLEVVDGLDGEASQSHLAFYRVPGFPLVR